MDELTEFETDQTLGTPHPRFSKRVLGQERTGEKFLKAYFNQKLHHAWMITGQKGIGKATLAWRMAKFLINFNSKTNSMGSINLETEIDSSLDSRIESLSEPSIILVRKNFDSKRKKPQTVIKVEDIRNMSESIGFTTPDDKPRVVIIDSIDDLNENATNAFLKVLEEPPQKTYFLLVSHSPLNILSTIRSRCMIVNCDVLQPDIQLEIIGQFPLENKNKLSEAIQLSDGSVGNTVSIIQHQGIHLYESIVRIYEKLDTSNSHKMMALLAKLSNPKNTNIFSLSLHLIDQLYLRMVRMGVHGLLKEEIFSGEFTLLKNLSPNKQKAIQWAEEFGRIKFMNEEYKKGNIDSFSHVFEVLDGISKNANL